MVCWTPSHFSPMNYINHWHRTREAHAISCPQKVAKTGLKSAIVWASIFKSAILDKIGTWYSLKGKFPANLIFLTTQESRLPKESSWTRLQMTERAPMPAARSSPSVTLYGTSKNFCSDAPSNPLFVDKPAVQIAWNPLSWDNDWPNFGPSNPLFLDKKWLELLACAHSATCFSLMDYSGVNPAEYVVGTGGLRGAELELEKLPLSLVLSLHLLQATRSNSSTNFFILWVHR